MRTGREGFTVVDVMLACGIVAIVLAAVLPSVHVYQTRTGVDFAARTTTAFLRAARERARFGWDDAAWGVAVDGGTITLFQGSSYAARDAAYDETATYVTSATITGTTEYVFSLATGRTTGGALTFTAPNGDAQIVTVTALGSATYE